MIRRTLSAVVWRVAARCRTFQGVPHRIEWYPGVEHGFVFPQRAIYDRDAAERHWERLFSLFRRTLA